LGREMGGPPICIVAGGHLRNECDIKKNEK